MEAIIFYLYCEHRFITFHTRVFIFATYFISYGLLFVLNLFKSIELNTIVFTLANLLIIKIVYNTSFGTALFHSLITTCIVSLSEITIIGLSSQFTGTVLYTLSDITSLSALTIASKLLYYFSLSCIARLLPFSSEAKRTLETSTVRGYKHSYFDKATAMLYVIPLISIYITIVLLGVLLNTGIPSKLRYMLSLSAALLIFINVLVFYIYHYTINKNSELTELQIQYQKENDMAEYYKKLFVKNEDQQILIHDIRKHLMSISNLNERNEKEKIRQYLKTLLESSDLQNSIHISDNEMLNSIISHYMQICENKHIDLKTDIRKNSLRYVDYSDLTTLFCNLLENSIEACEDIPDSVIELNISLKENTNLSIINIVNTRANAPKFNKSGIPVTTKSNRLRHGIGLKSIERVIKKYNGNIKMYYDEKCMNFHTIIILKDMQKNCR
ncbi:MAG: GHKL domain-containing protein [Lachnospiraceae bacterium]|nr:GHKL domain-containing protein [Lachnospiraceae bacterium]